VNEVLILRSLDFDWVVHMWLVERNNLPDDLETALAVSVHLRPPRRGGIPAEDGVEEGQDDEEHVRDGQHPGCRVC
jgi:hypothetical protein